MQNDECRKFASIFVQNDDALPFARAPSNCTKIFYKLKNFCAFCTIKKLRTFVQFTQKVLNVIVQVAVVQPTQMLN